MLNYSRIPVQLALFAEVLNNPVAAIPEVKLAMEHLLTKRWPGSKPRQCVVENNVFASVTAAAYWLHFKTSTEWTKSQAGSNGSINLHKVIDNLMCLIRNRCDAMDYQWTNGTQGRKGVCDEGWMWYDAELHEGITASKDANGKPVQETCEDYGFKDLRSFDYTALKLQ